jgi:hypothetical protein
MPSVKDMVIAMKGGDPKKWDIKRPYVKDQIKKGNYKPGSTAAPAYLRNNEGPNTDPGCASPGCHPKAKPVGRPNA